jgi:hypothetical protein
VEAELREGHRVMDSMRRRLKNLEAAWSEVAAEDEDARRERVFADLNEREQRRWDSILADITDEERRWIYEPANNEERAKGIKVVQEATKFRKQT